MARRRSARAKKPVRKPIKLDREFKCPFCDHDKSVTCVMIKKQGEPHVGCLRCRVCFEHYSKPIGNLAEPIDVYTSWLDACERANNPQLVQEEEIEVII
ncbi:hypothetical protein M758_4G236800 [Ceratodon purpureus]|nr:hypothetical protein M758_4G236800 [Ceratodon purpureus]